jgi:succinate dehydrogenase / fumarate reductase flavoprotein subunit
VGGLQPESTIPGLFVLGEANFSDHGANRLGASALMQGLADGYFVMPYTIGNYLAAWQEYRSTPTTRVRQEVEAEVAGAHRSSSCRHRWHQAPRHFHRELGKIMWDECGMAATRQGLEKRSRRSPKLREEFWNDVKSPAADDLNRRWRRPAASPTSSSSAS